MAGLDFMNEQLSAFFVEVQLAMSKAIENLNPAQKRNELPFF